MGKPGRFLIATGKGWRFG